MQEKTSELKDSQAERVNSALLRLSALLRPVGGRVVSPPTGERNLLRSTCRFTQCTGTSTKHIQKHLHRHTQEPFNWISERPQLSHGDAPNLLSHLLLFLTVFVVRMPGFWLAPRFPAVHTVHPHSLSCVRASTEVLRISGGDTLKLLGSTQALEAILGDDSLLSHYYN